MSELIDRQTAMDALNSMELSDADFGYICGVQDAAEIIANIPEAPKKVFAQIKVDTDEIIERIKEDYDLGEKITRCKDCTWLRPNTGTGYCTVWHRETEPAGYCHKGAGRDGTRRR